MNANIYSIEGNIVGEIELPDVFNTSYRPDIIKRAVLSIQSERYQPYGSDPMAGKRTSAHYHGSRHYRWSMMNKETSRMPRIHGKVGYLAWTARFAPQAVKGRRAHPPKTEKIIVERINKKEKRFALKSALASTGNAEIIRSRGHKLNGIKPPIIVDDLFENINKSKDVLEFMSKIGLDEELMRAKKKKIRAGRGKMRSRVYKKKKGPLIVVSKKCPLLKSAKNIAGVDVVEVRNLNVELLAPGTHPGRLTIFTKSSIDMLKNIR